jgi:hypothetical protein
MKLKVLLLSGFLFSTVLILAQTNFQPGYVIKTNGDTVFGKIDYRGDLLMSEICKFKLNDNADEIVYSPGDIAAYRFNNDKYFISKEVKGKKIFLEFLIKGQVSVFYMRDDNGDHFFIEKTGLGLAEIPYKESIKYKDNESYYFKSTTHIGILNLYMQDAPKLQGRIAEF